MPRAVLRWSLRLGAAYFVAVTAAHWAGCKVPGLFIYYSIPSYPYLDRGIGTLSFGWAVFIWTASREPSLVPAVLIAGAAGILGFSTINLSHEMAALAAPRDLAVFWIEIAALAAYLGWLAAWSRLAERDRRTAADREGSSAGRSREDERL